MISFREMLVTDERTSEGRVDLKCAMNKEQKLYEYVHGEGCITLHALHNITYPISSFLQELNKGYEGRANPYQR